MNGRGWNGLRKRVAPPLYSLENKKREGSKNLETVPPISFFFLKGNILSSYLEKKDLLRGSGIKKKSLQLSRCETVENFCLDAEKIKETLPFSLPPSLFQGPILLVSFLSTAQSFGIGREVFSEKKNSEKDFLFFEGIRVIEKNFIEKPLLLGGFYNGKFFHTNDLLHLFALSPTYPFLRRNLVIQINSSLSHCGNWLPHPSLCLQNKIKAYLPPFLKVLSLLRDEKKILP